MFVGAWPRFWLGYLGDRSSAVVSTTEPLVGIGRAKLSILFETICSCYFARVWFSRQIHGWINTFGGSGLMILWGPLAWTDRLLER